MTQYIFLSVFLLAALITDLRSGRIPDVLSLTVLLLALIPRLVSGNAKEVIPCILTAALLMISMLPLFMLRALGGGDVKFCAALGAWLGLRETYLLLFTALVIAAAMGLVLIARKKRYIRFAVPLTVAAVVRVGITVLGLKGIL